VQESRSHAGSSDAYTEVMTDTSSGTESGDSVTGSFTQTTTAGSTTSTLQDSGSDGGGAYSVVESDTGTYTASNTGNSVTGSYSETKTSSDSYTMTETCSAYTVTESGTNQATTAETGNSLTADYSRSISGSDTYTLTESGTNAYGSYNETVTGHDTYTQTETGNSLNQTFNRTTTGTGTYTRQESGPGASQGPWSDSLNYTVQETGDSRAGVLSQSETGNDRYSLLESFDNVANAGSGTSPGHLDYSPFGLTFGDPPPVPKEPPTEFAEGAPDQSKPKGTNWKVVQGAASGDLYWITNTGVLNGFLYLKGQNKIIPLGECKWLNGHNLFFYAFDDKRNLSTAVLFNVEPIANSDKAKITQAFKDAVAPSDKLMKDFPKNGTAADMQKARAELTKADLKSIADFQDWIQQNAKIFVESAGGSVKIGGKERDFIPDKGYYNILMYKWALKDGQTVVYRLKAPDKVGDPAKWVEYKKIKGDGEVISE